MTILKRNIGIILTELRKICEQKLLEFIKENLLHKFCEKMVENCQVFGKLREIFFENIGTNSKKILKISDDFRINLDKILKNFVINSTKPFKTYGNIQTKI